LAEPTSEGLRTRKGGPWTSQQIRRTIEHPYDAGYVVMNGERRDGDKNR
jgi:hypothetical protein